MVCRNSRWSGGCGGMDVQVIVSESCMSTGDALRDIDAKSIIHSDFVLINGDLVSNVKLSSLIQQHRSPANTLYTATSSIFHLNSPKG